MATDLQDAIIADRQAVAAFVAAARSVSPAQWTAPRAPGKWSPGQVTEHVALAYEQNRRMLLGTFTGPAQPRFKQMLGRWLFLPRMFQRGNFCKSPFRATDFLQPSVSTAPSR